MTFGIRTLNYNQTVERELVHKSAVSEVLLTDAFECAGAVRVGAQWPRKHWFFGQPHDALNPLLVTETFRQAWLLVAHRYYAVPLAAHIVMEEIDVETFVPAVSARGASELELEFRPLGVTRRQSGEVSRLELVARALLRGAQIARGRGSAIILDEFAYQRFRRRGADMTERPMHIDWATPVTIDLDHPVFFDHTNDHVPGMLLVSIAHDQISQQVPTITIKARFSTYFDLDSPIQLARSGPQRQVAFLQHGIVGARVRCMPRRL